MLPKKIIFSYLQISNVGCEIIIRGTIKFLTRALPHHDLIFVLSSYDVERDRAILSDLSNVVIIPMLGWKRLVRGVLVKTGLNKKYWTPRFSTRYFRDANLFVSIGGDIYTMFGNKPPEDWIGYERFATSHDIPSIMFGANMERFEILQESDRSRLLDHLHRFQLIAVRDSATRDYLANFNVTNNVVVFPDPIFSLRPQTVFRKNNIQTIGFNISPYVKKNFGPAEIGRYAGIIANLVDHGHKLRLIPHVYANDGNPSLDDRACLKELYKALPDNIRTKVDLYQGPISFHEISKEIDKVDLFIGTRMHACLNALTLGKPTFFIGYSAKAETMVNWLKSYSPFSPVAESIDTAMVPAVSFEQLSTFIKKQQHLGSAEIVIETEAFLSKASIWQKIPDAGRKLLTQASTSGEKS